MKFRIYLYLIYSFLFGVLTMIFEFNIIRIFSNHFGGTVNVSASVIGSIILGFTAGYFISEKIQQKKEEHVTQQSDTLNLSLTLTAVSFLISCLSIYYLLEIVNSLPDFFTNLNLYLILSALILNFIPFTFLTLSLFLLATNVIKLKGVDFGISKIYTVNNIGSLAGILLWLFYIPNILESHQINTLVVFIFAFISLSFNLSNLKDKEPKESLNKILLIISLALFTFSCYFFYTDQAFSPKKDNLVFFKSTKYNNVSIYKIPYIDDQNLIQLRFDNSGSQGELLLNKNTLDKNFYNDYFKIAAAISEDFFLHNLKSGGTSSALFLGGGAYIIPDYLNTKYPNVKVSVSEIDKSLLPIAEKYLNINLSSSSLVTNTDARIFLEESSRQNKKYDYILVDIFNNNTPPSHTITKEFAELLKKDLASDGMIMVNLVAKKDSFYYESMLKTYSKSFKYIKTFNSDSGKESVSPENIILLLSNNVEAFLNLKDKYTLSADDGFAVKDINKDDIEDFKNGIVITDENTDPHILSR